MTRLKMGAAITFLAGLLSFCYLLYGLKGAVLAAWVVFAIVVFGVAIIGSCRTADRLTPTDFVFSLRAVIVQISQEWFIWLVAAIMVGLSLIVWNGIQGL